MSMPQSDVRRSRRSNRNTSTSSGEIVFPDTGCCCIDSEERKALVREWKPATVHFIYHLYLYSQDCDGPKPIPRICRTYSSPYVAQHDALCWLFQQHHKAGVS